MPKTVEQQIRRLQAMGTTNAIRERHRAAREAAQRLQNKGAPVTTAGGDPSFLSALARRAKATKGPGQRPRVDLTQAIQNMRAEKGLAAPDGDATGHEPTPEEVLADLDSETTEETQDSVPQHATEEDCPDPDTVLDGDSSRETDEETG